MFSISAVDVGLGFVETALQLLLRFHFTTIKIGIVVFLTPSRRELSALEIRSTRNCEYLLPNADCNLTGPL